VRPEVFHIPNTFRTSRLYTKPVNALLLRRMPLLRAIFKHYCASKNELSTLNARQGPHAPPQVITLAGWQRFVEDSQVRRVG
jgi:hypothetical protein